MVRPVTIRTTRSAQAASNALRTPDAIGAGQVAQGGTVEGGIRGAVKPVTRTVGGAFGGFFDRIGENIRAGTEDIRSGTGGFPAGVQNIRANIYQGWTGRPYTPPSTTVTPGGGYTSTGGMDTEAARNIAAYARSFGLDPDTTDVTEQVAGIWDILESQRLVEEAISQQMIDNAIAMASLPYDEKLTAIGRDIQDTRGRLTDLDKLTDYYQASLVEPWRKAADAAKSVDATTVELAIANRVAEVGKAFDVADENVQDYLDQIGGVPTAQKIAITDGIREFQNPFEGLAEGDMLGIMNIVDAQGNFLEQSAIAAQAQLQFEAELGRFQTAAMLGKNLDKLYAERSDTIANRDRAVDLAKQQANAQYGYTGEMPERSAFLDMALTNTLGSFGLDPTDSANYMDMFQSLLEGTNPAFSEPVYDLEGNLIGNPMKITTQLQLETAFSKLSAGERAAAKDDFEVLQDLFAAYESASKEYDGRLAYIRTGGGGRSAPDNIANWQAQTPSYVQRQQYVQGYIPMLRDKFPELANVSIQQMRPLDMYNPQGGQSKNSDHYSGGALDIMVSDVGLGNRIISYLQSFPSFNYAVWQKPNHYDHVHVSFLLPDQIGGGQPTANFTGEVTDSNPVVTSVSRETRDAVNRVIYLRDKFGAN